ncbi:EVE domain-containing protein [Pontibacillus yanchengensis]|uniref:EVE domain-containing protein n=1 Tax=Pontibacillus yanchengensis TaxID=462910 RepID=A0A6I5A6M1_9BACI|nr:HI_0552 family protein [Pontibacillus yanchengensis]MYL35842.1 EVE domain-containing protein [Pontibacillus yanchengensis]
MKISDKQFELFDREQFLFAKMKEELSEEEINGVKESYKEAWGYWKTVMDQVRNLLSQEFIAEMENWTNGWSVRNRFWARLKYKGREKSSSCISTMINKNTLRVYLEWHNHHSENSYNSVHEHNNWIEHVEEWIANQNINPSEYRVWTSLESDSEKYITLETYLSDQEVQEQYKDILSHSEDIWIRVGKVFAKEEVVKWNNAEQEIASVIEDLQGIYDKTQDGSFTNRNYWLFNVFYSKNPMVWEKCKEYGVAAMQYENGKQSQSAVTRNIKLIREIAVGDYIIAYTGDKCFLALGQVTKPLFNEEDESKLIYADPEKDEGWKQRIGVNWFEIMEEPVRSSESGLRKRLGIDPTTVMSSATLFKIPEKGYCFVRKLINEYNLNESPLSNTFSAIFNSKKEAEWAFNFVKKTLEKLGVLEPGEPRVSITLPNKKIHVNYCNWLILGFYKNYSGSLSLKLALVESDVNNTYNSERFVMKEGEEPVSLVYVTLEDYQNNSHIQDAYNRTLNIIKERFKRYTRSPYKKFNNEQIEQAVFSQEIRNRVLTNEIPNSNSTQETSKSGYFWLTANPSIWTVENIKGGGVVNYTAYNEKGNKRRIFSAFENAQPGDKILFYESTPRKEIIAQGEVVEGLHTIEDEIEGQIQGVSFRFFDEITPISWETISQVEELQDCSPIKNAAQGSLFEITKEQFETILSLEPTQMIKKDVEIPYISFEKDLTLNNLYFEEIDLLLKQVKTALQNGKHIILTGPPGTGKSKLAKQICEIFEAEYEMSTANSDWSTYETIGGYRPNSDGTLSFNPGLFLQCFKDEITYKPINKWLIIDEMNRADIDKAFGSLFSALTGDPITLNFQKESGQPLLLRPQGEEKTVVPSDHEYVIPNTWRLIGTINTLDKASLYEMSYAFMRRFAFIPVGVPRQIDESLVQKFLNTWNINNYAYTESLAFTWQEINKYRRIGPAIMEDIAKYIIEDGDLTSAIILYVLPQFEGLMDKDILEFIEGISHLQEIEDDKLKQFTEDYFHIKG